VAVAAAAAGAAALFHLLLPLEFVFGSEISIDFDISV
jgi:hypothetical protein